MFNMALSKPWVEFEHAICIWKGTFPWLHSIPMIMKQSTQKEDLSHILEVIPNEWMDDKASDVSNAISDTDELNHPLGEAEPNNQRCKQLNLYINVNYI